MNCILENIRQEKLCKNSAIRFQLTFVLTPKSAVKSSRQTRPIFSAITNSLHSRIKKTCRCLQRCKSDLPETPEEGRTNLGKRSEYKDAQNLLCLPTTKLQRYLF